VDKNSFIIKGTKNKEYPIIVYSLEYATLTDYIWGVEEILKKKSYNGIVLFDLLQSNGLNDRYYSIPFNGIKFEYNNISNKIILPQEVIALTNSFYKKNNNILANGVLNNVQKLRLSKQYAN
jgi:hypothetical protein